MLHHFLIFALDENLVSLVVNHEMIFVIHWGKRRYVIGEAVHLVH